MAVFCTAHLPLHWTTLQQHRPLAVTAYAFADADSFHGFSGITWPVNAVHQGTEQPHVSSAESLHEQSCWSPLGPAEMDAVQYDASVLLNCFPAQVDSFIAALPPCRISTRLWFPCPMTTRSRGSCFIACSSVRDVMHLFALVPTSRWMCTRGRARSQSALAGVAGPLCGASDFGTDPRSCRSVKMDRLSRQIGSCLTAHVRAQIIVTCGLFLIILRC